MIKKTISSLIIISFLLGCESKEISKAKEYMDANMFEQAISLLELELLSEPKNAEVSFLLGKCYLETGNANSEKYFNRAILLESGYRKKTGLIFFEKSFNNSKLGNLSVAKKYLDEAEKYDPSGNEDFAEKLFKSAIEESEISTDSKKIINLFIWVIEIDPLMKNKIAEISWDLADKLFSSGFIDQAFAYGEFSIMHKPDFINKLSKLYLVRAEELLNQLKSSKAISYFERSIELNSSNKNKVSNILHDISIKYETEKNMDLALYFAEVSASFDDKYSRYYVEMKKKYYPQNETDKYEPNNYKTIKIGDQIWLNKNLNIGTMIDGGDMMSNDNLLEKYCYDNNETNCGKYGGLYTWDEAMKYTGGKANQGICPNGFHIPAREDFLKLIKNVGYNGNKLKALGEGRASGSGNNSSGFSALLSGWYFDGNFNNLGNYTAYWSSTENGFLDANNFNLYTNNGTVDVNSHSKKYAYSIRCIKD